MSKEIASLHARIGADVSGLTGGLDAAQSALEGTSAKMVAVGTFASGILMKGLGAIVGQLDNIKKAMIDGNAEFERYKVQFGVLLKSAEAAGDRIAELEEFGLKTPFELPEIIRADKILQAFGFHAEDAAKKFGMSGKEIRTIAGDVASGTGASFEEIASNLGRFASGATGIALQRFAELGIITRKQLQDAGIKFDGGGALKSSADETMTVILAMMKEKFGGMMDAQSATFEGMQSNLQDWIGKAGRTLGAPIFDALKEGLGGLLEVLGSDETMRSMEALAKNLGGIVSGVIGFVKSLSGIFSGGDPFGALLNSFNNLLTSFGMSRDAAAKVAGTIATIGSALYNIFQKGDPSALLSLLKGWADAFVGWVDGMLPQLGEKVAGIANSIGAWIVQYAPGIIQSLASWAAAFLDWWYTVLLPGVAERLSVIVGAIGQWVIANAPAIAEQLKVWAEQFLGWVQAAVIPFLTERITSIINVISSWITTNAPIIAEQLKLWAAAFLSWVETDATPFIADKLNAFWQVVSTWVSEQAQPLREQLSTWVDSAVAWVNDAVARLPDELVKFWGKLYEWINTTAKNLIDHQEDLAKAITEWINTKAVPWLKTEFPKFVAVLGALIIGIPLALAVTIGVAALGIVNALVDKIKEGIKNEVVRLIAAGKEIVDGLVAGIEAAGKAVFDAFVKLINDNIQAVKDFFGWHSPAPFAVQMGKEIGQGLVVGMLSMSSAVGGAMQSLVDMAVVPYERPQYVRDQFREPQTGGGWQSGSGAAPQMPQQALVIVKIGEQTIERVVTGIVYDSMRASYA